MKTILLTGATWYIGSHTAVKFIQHGYEVIILDNLYNSDISTLKSITAITGISPKFYNIDLRDKKSLQTVFEENSIDAVIHFAWLKAVGESCKNPFLYYDNNIIGSLNLFELMDQYNVNTIIFSSSATVYNTLVWTSPFLETDIIWNTTNPYGTTKFILEYILRDLAIHKNFRVINLRYFNPIGAHKSGLLWENPNGIPNNLLPYVLKVALQELPAVQVFGNDYDTKDGTGERDYIHVLDLAKAHVQALTYGLKQQNNLYEEINIGTWYPTSVLEIIALTEQVIGHQLPTIISPRRPWDAAIVYCNPTKAKKLLGWEAHYSVAEAIQDSWNFITNQANFQ